MRALLLALLLGLPGCDLILGIPDPSLRGDGGGDGDGDGGGDGAVDQRVIILARDILHLEDGTTVDVPQPAASVSMEAYRLDGTTFSAPIPATLMDAATGTWAIDGIPPGEEFYLRYTYNVSTNQYMVTRARSIDVGADFAGRGGADAASAGTQLVVDLQGMTPWSPGDVLLLVIPNLAMYTNVDANPPNNATSVFDVAVGWEGSPLIHASLGDSVRFLHTTERTIGGGLTATMIADHSLVAPIEQVDGVSTPVTGFFNPVATANSARIDWRLSEFHAALESSTGPPTTPGPASLAITPRWGVIPVMSTGTDLAGNVDLGTVSFGNPFPASLGIARYLDVFDDATFQIPGATPSNFPQGSDPYGPWINMYEDLTEADDVVRPLVRPPVDIRVNDVPLDEVPPAFTRVQFDQPLVVSWQDDPVTLNAPTYYRIRVFRLFRGTDGATARQRVLTLVSGSPTFTMPPGVLEPDRYYYVLATSEYRTSSLTEATPFRRATRSASAQRVSGIFQTYDPALPDAGVPDAMP